MTPDELPQELERWPTDPYALLAVGHDVTLKDLKRAYARRIRKFKPEHFPEHFRRLREAYETIEQFAKWREIAPGIVVEPAESPVEAPAEVPPETSPELAPEPARDVPAPRVEETPWSGQLAEAWNLAVDGSPAEAYARLRALDDRQPGNPDVCARLYWLLWIEPELDSTRTRCDWLVAGLSNTGLSGPLRELYSREISADGHEALRERSIKLFDASASPGLLASFVEERWRAAASLGDSGPTVAADLQRLERRISGDDEDVWLRLVATGIEHLTWSTHEDLRLRAKEYREQIDAAEHLHRRMEYLLDYLEISSEVANVWRYWGTQGDLRHRMAEMVRRWRLADASKLRIELEAVFRPMLTAPTGLLFMLDGELRESSVAMMALRQIIDQVANTGDGWSDERREEELNNVVRGFARSVDFSDYDRLRAEIAKFCAREGLLAEQFRQALEAISVGYPRSVLDQLEADIALECTLKAYRVFWS
jgi:hypothetical protein